MTHLVVHVVAHHDVISVDADDRAPRNGLVNIVAADADVLEPAAVSDAEAGDSQLRRGQLTAEVVTTAERLAGFRDDLATQQ